MSHEVSPLMKFVARGDTTVVDAYLSPILRRYVEQVGAMMPGVRLFFMQSSGGLTEAHHFQGKDAILSGPAGGIVGMVRTALAAGHRKLIGFDMGGTSTDVSHHAGEFERAFETQVAGVRMRAPMMSIHTVAAGGGSILGFDGARLRVGPRSAGADPGPASYRRGGPLATTDANVLLGRIQPMHFPHVFGPDGNQSLDAAGVRTQFEALAAQVQAATGRPTSAETLAAGYLRIAVKAMANAIKRISVARGYDVTGYTLQCFGGAGGQHACGVADALGMTRIFIHPLAGVLSAYGMGLADQIAMREASIEQLLDAAGLAAARVRLAGLGRAASDELVAQGVPAQAVERRQMLHLRYQGTDTALVVPLTDLHGARQAFEAGYRQRFAFLMPERPLVIEAVSVEAIGPGEDSADAVAAPATEAYDPPADERIRMYCEADEHDAGWRDAGLFVRERLRVGARIDGPAIIAEANATIGGRARLAGAGEQRRRAGTAAQPCPRHAPCHRHRRRPGDAGGVQQPVHEHCRADGPAPAEHRPLGEHQGAAGLQLRVVQCRRGVDRQRAAHAGAPGQHEREHQDRDPAQPADAAGRCVRAERPVPRRHASARRDRGDAGVPGR